MKQLFLEIYGTLKNCGRVVCIQLISLAKQIGTAENYGNEKTGFINIDAMQSLYEQIKLENC